MSVTKARVFGLDVMRAAAIVGVVISHLTGYVPDLLFSHALDKLGMPGVEIFFVLSGFLIGGILVRLLDQGRFSQRGELLHFWLNRWFRTLPLYFLYLAAIVLFTTQHPFAERLRIYELYPFFLQNFAWNIGMTSFSHSWSLTIEESFYLFFPLILWLFLRVVPQRPRRVFFATILLFLLVPFILRVIHGPAANMAGFDASIRKWVVFRLDALMFGVGMAAVRRYIPDFWLALSRVSGAVALLAVGVIIVSTFGLSFVFVFPSLQLVFFPVISLAAALILPFADNWKVQPGLAARATEGISCSSYSTYLAHPFLLIFADRLLHSAHLSLPGWLAALAITVAVFVGSYLLYLLTERPLMQVRERWNRRYASMRETAAPSRLRNRQVGAC